MEFFILYYTLFYIQQIYLCIIFVCRPELHRENMERFEVAYKTQCQALHKTGIDSGTLKSTVPNSIISLSELIIKA